MLVCMINVSSLPTAYNATALHITPYNQTPKGMVCLSTNFPNRQSWHNTYNCQIFFWWGWARRRRLCARQNWGVLRVTANAKQPVPILQKSKNRCALTIAPCPGNKALKAQCAVPVGQSNACSHFFPSLYKQRTVGAGPRRAKQCVQSLFSEPL